MSNMSTYSNRHILSDERGLASIMITMIMMIVITLIVIGFAQVSRREQRQALDQQLSAAAYYAAESGVNDAINLLVSNPNAGEKKTCGKDPANTNWDGLYNPNANKGNILDEGSDVRYTCLLVNPQPGQLEKDLSVGSAWVVPLKTANGTNFSSIRFVWTRLGGTGVVSNCPATSGTYYNFPAVGGAWNCPYGLLRYDLVPIKASMTANSLLQDATRMRFT